IRQALARGGVTTQPQPATWLLRLPTRVLTFFAGGGVNNLVADRLTTLAAPTVQVLLHPSDMVISGRKTAAARAHALITEELTFTRAYLTWDQEANQVEDQLRAIWHGVEQQGASFAPAGLERVRLVGADLKKVDLPYEEWEVLFR